MSPFDFNTNSEIFIDPDPDISPVFTELSTLYISPAGHSVIYKGKRFGKWHALKTLKAEYKDLPQYKNLLLKEFEISYLLNHPDIIQVIGLEAIEVAPDDTRLCIIMEYIDGITLEEFMNTNAVNAQEIFPILEEICNAINYIHKKGIIHKDIKTTNILVTHNGNHAKLIDFGLSDASNYAILKEAAGSYPYASPEQKNSRIAIDNRADIYALGMILKFIDGQAVTKLPHAREVIKKCTAQDRKKRFTTAKEVLRRLSNTKKDMTLAIIISIFITAVVSSLLAYNMGLYLRYNEKHNRLRGIDQQSIEAAAPIIIYDSISRLVIRKATQDCRAIMDTIDHIPGIRNKLIRINIFHKQMQQGVEDKYIKILNQYLPVQSPEYNLYKTSIIQLAEDIYKKFHAAQTDSLRLLWKEYKEKSGENL